VKRLALLQSAVEYVRGSLWVLPSVTVVLSAVAGGVLTRVEVGDHWFFSEVLFPGGAEGARGMLQAVAGSVITVTSLVFSLTVVTLQLASTQFSPRLLRTFLRHPSNQVVLSIFLSTFVYALVVLRSVRSGEDGGEDFVPALAITVAFVLVLASVGALVFFIHHITSEIRADTLMQRVETDALSTLERVHPEPIDRDRPLPGLADPPPSAVVLPALRAGIVQALASTLLLDAATQHGVVLRLAVRVGDRVVRHGVLGWIWSSGTRDAPDMTTLTHDVNGALTIGHERTMQQDVSFGLRQLVDIAAKALSPGVNDPTTAADAVGHLTSILTTIASRQTADLVLEDEDGTPRVFVPQHSFADYLAIAVSQIRRYGSSEPDIVAALLDLLREVAEAVVDPRSAEAVEHELALIVAAAHANIAQGADLQAVDAAAKRVRMALSGSPFARLTQTSERP
jgi:uncharacterized membrane protein